MLSHQTCCFGCLNAGGGCQSWTGLQSDKTQKDQEQRWQEEKQVEEASQVEEAK